MEKSLNACMMISVSHFCSVTVSVYAMQQQNTDKLWLGTKENDSLSVVSNRSVSICCNLANPPTDRSC